MAKTDPDSTIIELDPAVREMLIEDLPRQLADIRTALKLGNTETAASLVHSVLGSAAFCQLEALRNSAAQLESALKKNKKDATTIRAFENDATRVLHALENNRNSE